MAEPDDLDNNQRTLRRVDEALELVEILHQRGVEAWINHVRESPPTQSAVFALVSIVRKEFEREATRVGVSFEEITRQVRLQALDAAEE